MKSNEGNNSKIKYRTPHIMTDSDLDDFLELLSEAIYQGVGKIRTNVFDFDSIFPLVPPSRMHFNYAEMVYSEKVDEIIDELAHQKAHSLAVRLVSDKIVKALQTANGKDYEDAEITVNDFLSKMFLESGKGNFDTTRLSVELMEDFEKTITVTPDVVAEALIDKCHEFLDKQVALIQEEQAEVKADFSLYSTFQFLNDDLTASIELISENVGLESSQISSRFTRTLVNTDTYDIKRPHDPDHFILHADDSPNQVLWANMTANAS